MKMFVLSLMSLSQMSPKYLARNIDRRSREERGFASQEPCLGIKRDKYIFKSVVDMAPALPVKPETNSRRLSLSATYSL